MERIEFGSLGGAWLSGEGAEGDIVVSSRVRLARNLRQIPFLPQASPREKSEAADLIRSRVMGTAFREAGWYVEMEALDEVDQAYLIERHLISRELANGEGKRGVAFDRQEVASVMVNEEDHLRMQAILPGFDLDGAWRAMETLDRLLEGELDFAFSPQFGYLTACPTNVGTGMRASAMLHLPALVMTKQIEKVFQAVSKINLAVRGAYGEGTQASGDFYQISNQVSLGLSEATILENLKRVVPQILKFERSVREHLLTENRTALEDKVFRAFGLLTQARSITTEEAVRLLSALRLGVNSALLPGLRMERVNELFILAQPGHLQKMEAKVLEPKDRDVVRAKFIRSRLA